MATHSSILAGEIPWTGKPGRLQSMGSQIVRYDLVTKQKQQNRFYPPWSNPNFYHFFDKQLLLWCQVLYYILSIILKEISPEYSSEGRCWSWSSNTLATSFKELTHLKRPWCWERLKAGEGDDRGWDGWMASLTQWTWIWVGFRSWWWTERPGVLQSMGSQRVRHDWAIELNYN